MFTDLSYGGCRNRPVNSVPWSHDNYNQCCLPHIKIFAPFHQVTHHQFTCVSSRGTYLPTLFSNQCKIYNIRHLKVLGLLPNTYLPISSEVVGQEATQSDSLIRNQVQCGKSTKQTALFSPQRGRRVLKT